MMGIRTPDHRVRVFISSTMGELADERGAVRRAVESLRLIPVLFETGARPHPPRALYRAYLDQSDVFVGIYWERYGWVAPNEEVSGLEDEYRLATGRMPQLVYIKEPAPKREPGLEDLLRTIQSDDRLAYRRFSTSDELASLVADDLAVLLSERFPREDRSDITTRRNGGPPVPLDRTVGREQDVIALTELVRAGSRFISLTGPGGIGKTRLAIEAARTLSREFDDSVVFVPLADVTDAGLVLSSLADRLGIRLGGVGDVVDELTAEISRRPTLLVFDNFEHVASAAPDVVALLERCPTATALVTTRHVLRVRGEREYPVAPLNDEAAATLFNERSIAARPSFMLDDTNRAEIAEIARQLDGLPLAIELAAACMRLFSPSKLLEELSHRMDILTRGATDASARQRTLRATMDWSYDLLDAHEQQLFVRLAVFSGSWSLTAAEAVCSRADEPDVLETLASLVEKSLVVSLDDPSGEPRLRMLETVRAYALEKLELVADRDETERRHTAWMFELLIGPSRSIRPPHHQSWLERFDPDRPNLRAAVERALRDGDAATATNLVRASIGYLSLRDAEAEADKWLETADSFAGTTAPAVRAQTLITRAVLNGALGRYEKARELIDRSRACEAPSDDPLDIAIAAMAEAVVVSAKEQTRRSLEAAIAAADAMAVIDSDVGQAYMWQTAGTIALSCDPPRADGFLRKALALADSMQNDGLRAQALTLLGYSTRRDGRLTEARSLFVSAAEASLRSGQRSSMAYALDGLSATSNDAGLHEIAAEAIACSRVVRSRLDRTAWASFDPLLEEVRQATAAQLGDQAYRAAAERGAIADVRQMVLRALDALSAAAR